MLSAVLFAVAAVPGAQAVPAQIVQQSTGWCSPNFANIKGNVTVNCIGVDPRALKALNEQLAAKNLQWEEAVQQADEWTRRYKLMEKRLQASGDDPVMTARAKAYLTAGDLDKAAAILDKLIDPGEKSVDRQADRLFNRGVIAEMQFQPGKALPYLEKAYRYRPEELEYGGEYARALINQHDYKKAEAACTATLERARELAKEDPPAHQPEVAHALTQLGFLYVATDRFEEGRAAYKEAIGIYESSPGHTLDYLDAGSRLADLLVMYHMLDGAEAVRLSLLDTWRQLAKGKPGGYDDEIGHALNSLSIVYDEERQFPKAEATAKEALEVRRRLAKQNPSAYEPSVAQTLGVLAHVQGETREFDQAEAAGKESLEIYRKLAAANPEVYATNVPMLLRTLGDTYLAEGKTKDAETSLEQALDGSRELAKDHPDTETISLVESLHSMARLYAATDRPQQAEASFRAALETYAPLVKQNQYGHLGEFAKMTNELGDVYRTTHRTADAESKYKAALTIRRHLAENPAYKPALAETLNDLGLVYTETQQGKEAEDSLKEALEIRRQLAKDNPVEYLPYVMQGLKELSDLYKQENRAADSTNAYMDALLAVAQYKVALQPNSAEEHGTLGATLQSRGDMDGAIAEYRKAIELKPDFATAHTSLGNALAGRKDYDGALVEYRRVVSINPGDAVVHYNIGYILSVKGQNEESFAEYRKAIELKPDYALAYNNLGYNLAEAGRFDEAIPLLEKAVKLKGDEPNYLDSYGFALAGKGDYAAALNNYDLALKGAPDMAIIHLHRAGALSKVGRASEANQELATAYRLDPHLKDQR